MNDTQTKYQPVTKYWSGKALKETESFILAYRISRDSDYFEQYLYPAFSTLINFYLLRNARTRPEMHNDITNFCYVNLMKVLDKWDGKSSAFSYFGTCIKHIVLLHQQRLFTGNRDIRLETPLDGLEEHARDSILNSMVHEFDYEDAPNYLDTMNINKLRNFKDRIYKGNTMTYYNFLMNIVDGNIKLPTDMGRKELVPWMAKAAGFNLTKTFSQAQSQFKARFYKFLHNTDRKHHVKKLKENKYKDYDTNYYFTVIKPKKELQKKNLVSPVL